MIRLLIYALLFCAVGLAQQEVTLGNRPPRDPYTTRIFYDASNNPEYICYAQAFPPVTSTYRRSDDTITSITDSSNTSTAVVPNHGLAPGNLITITGSTTETDLNGEFIVQTVTDANTFTFTTASVTDAAYTTSTIVIVTTAPRDTAPLWVIRKVSYSSNYPIREQWSRPNSICANRATSTGATKVEYR